YSQCCLDSDSRLEPQEFIAALDRAGGRGVFARLYRRYAAMTEFPSQDAPYRALGISESDKDTLRFSDDAEAVRLRRAIMGARSTDTAPAKSD
ncbi:hypothetical protein AB4084_03240, partial [Lysobacter sp. 2RAB21]